MFKRLFTVTFETRVDLNFFKKANLSNKKLRCHTRFRFMLLIEHKAKDADFLK